jgi:hypothetical protein
MIVDKYGYYVRKFMWHGNCVGRIELTFLWTVHSRAILKILKSMCNDIKKIKCTLMKRQYVIQMSTLPHPNSCYINFRT